MVGNNPAFFLAEDTVLFLFSHKNHFYCFQKILLGNSFSSVLDCQDRRLVDHICQIGTYRAGRGKSDRFQIHTLVQKNVFRMNLQNLNTSLQIRTLHNDPPVETARTQQRRIQNFRTVGSGKDQKAFGSIKAIHLGKKLIQRLLTLIVSSVMGITGFTDGVDLIDKDDTRRILLCLFKQIADTGGTHADEHLNKLRTRQREERYVRLSRHRLRKQCFTGTRRADQQRSFRQLGSDLCIFSRIMQEIYHFLEGLFRLILSCHILEQNACFLLNIGFCFALSNAAHHAAAFIHAAHQPYHSANQQRDRKHQRYQGINEC